MTSKTKTCTKKTQTKTLKTSTGVKVLQNCRGTDKTLSNKEDNNIKDAIDMRWKKQTNTFLLNKC